MFAVIMAGGRGTRFWPKSRDRMPKHLLDILGGRTIIRATVDRIRPLVPVERILVVTGKSHAGELARQLPEIPRENILIEPVGRNTAPCIGLAALHILKRVPDDVMLVLPADHLIIGEDAFRRALLTASEAASLGASLVTIGIPPTGPETGYGYLERGDRSSTVGGLEIFKVRSIREKPPRDLAVQFLQLGRFFWNSGMFVWKASTIMDAIAQFLPGLHRGLMVIRDALGTESEYGAVETFYSLQESISIDYGVMEKAGDVLLLPGAFGWSDLGSWDALWEVSPKDEQGNVVQGRFIGVETANALIQGTGKLIAVVGLRDIVVVETEDALLVCRRGHSQDVRKVVEEIEKRGFKELL